MLPKDRDITKPLSYHQDERLNQRDLLPLGIFGRQLAGGSVGSAQLAGNTLASANTPNAIVKRDGSGNFSAGTITAALSGLASGNELPLSFTLPIQRSGNAISLSYSPLNKAGDTMSGNLTLGTAGNKLLVKEGTNAAMGVAVLVGGTKTVSNTLVTASSRILLTPQALGGTIGTPYISAVVAGTSFTITSSSGTDTSTIAWLIIEPAP